MLLTVDIGNTNIHFGLFKEKRLIREFKIPSKKFKTLKNKVNTSKIEAAVICSVVPKLTYEVKSVLGVRNTYIIGRDIKIPIKSRYNSGQIGQDRLVDAFAALDICRAPIVVIDIGTAITFDYISKKGVYEGGIIVPGVDLSLEVLYKKAALLPKVDLKDGERVVLCPTSTRKSIKSGMLNGFGSLIDGVIERFKKRYGRNITVIATGGYIKIIKHYCSSIDKTEPLLTLKGLRSAYFQNRKKIAKNKRK